MQPSKFYSGNNVTSEKRVVQARVINDRLNPRNIYPEEFTSYGYDGTVDYFPCPFCYVDVEVPVLCIHLQEEHCFDINNSVCPVCAGNLENDMIGHITLYHSHLLKCRKSRMRSSNLQSVERGPYEQQSSFIGATIKEKGKAPDTDTDLLLSPFINNSWKEEANSKLDSSPIPSISSQDQVEEKDCEERNQIANFLQEMLLSTIF